MRTVVVLMLVVVVLAFAGCGSAAPPGPRPGDLAARRGDEIMVAGKLFHTGAPVVLWTDPGGYDAYRVERRFTRPEEAGWDRAQGSLASPNWYGRRLTGDPARDERIWREGWTLEDLRGVVDQFVLHYDVAGTSRTCFRVLHDVRGLSVHFLLDVDGTIYQTLDVKERAWHATRANNRSVGVEIAHIGAYPEVDRGPSAAWYGPDGAGGVRLTIPDRLGDGGVRTPGFVGRPARPEPVRGVINGSELAMWDLTDEQYGSLIRLTAALHRALPGITLDYPRGPDGGVLTRTLDDREFGAFRGVLGHWHVQTNKIDPGPALDFERVVGGARRLLGIEDAGRRAYERSTSGSR
jgi:N-acetylmuramoyl-L-alanine amidase